MITSPTNFNKPSGNLSNWEIAGGAALVAVQFVPGLDLAVDGVEALEALEALEAAEAGAEAAEAAGEAGEAAEGAEGAEAEEAEEMEEGRKSRGCCFAAGTLVHTDHGDVPIEQIAVGDKVLSENRATGQVEYQPVIALTPQHKDALVDLTVDGETDLLRPSVSHPFWVEHDHVSLARWTAAGQIQVGDLVQTIQGYWKQVTSVTPETEPHDVYNFTVDKDHDYFVGETGYLVHNAGGCNCGLQKHHYTPKFLGGDPNGPLSTIPKGYHQLITNAFRTAAANTGPGYGYQFWRNGLPTPEELEDIMNEVYSQFPCSIDP